MINKQEEYQILNFFTKDGFEYHISSPAQESGIGKMNPQNN